jgi:hypothetical protein
MLLLCRKQSSSRTIYLFLTVCKAQETIGLLPWVSSLLTDINDWSTWMVCLRVFSEARTRPLPYRKLKGLSLFSGGGDLDRGLEEGGAVEFQTSVDYDSAAIHTQRANCQDPQNIRLFCGSVDDYLKSLLSGRTHRSVARVGEVDVIAAGSPCPGTCLVSYATRGCDH